MKCSLFYKDDKIHVEDIETGKVYPVKTFIRSTQTRWHITFFTRFDNKYWGMTGENGNFTAKKYVNYHQVVGGSGRHNCAYQRHRHGVK